MIHRILRVVDVLVHHVRGAARVPLVPEPDLADRPVLAEDVVHLVGGDVEREVTHVQRAVNLGREPRVPVLAQRRLLRHRRAHDP